MDKYPKGMRGCYVCKKVKPLELFVKDRCNWMGHNYRCKDCHNDMTRHRGTMRQLHPGMYEKLFESQNGKCAICGKESGKKHFSIDHNHVSGVVRGLLCTACNLGLSYFNEDISVLKSAISYLKKQ